AKETVSGDFRVKESRKLLVRNFTPRAGLATAPERTDPACPDGWLRLVHLGLIGKTRGWPQLLAAMAMMLRRCVQLEVIGEFNESTRDASEERVHELGIRDCVTLHDWMTFGDGFERLRAADVGFIVLH